VIKARSIFWAMSALALAASAESFAAFDVSLLSRKLFFSTCSCHQNMMAWTTPTATSNPMKNVVHQSMDDPGSPASRVLAGEVSLAGFGVGLDDC
jgi:hypothetical protein